MFHRYRITLQKVEKYRLKKIDLLFLLIEGNTNAEFVIKNQFHKQWQAYSFSSLFILDVAT